MRTCILTELGIAVYDGDKPARSFPFDEPARRYLEIKNGTCRIDDVARYLADADAVEVSDESLRSALQRESINCTLMGGEERDKIQSTKPAILADAGFAGDEADAMSKLRDFAIQLSSSKVAEASGSADTHMIRATNILDDIDKVANIMGAHMREWYGLHFPELDNIIDGMTGYSKLVMAGRRDALSRDVFDEAGFPESKAEILELVRQKSRGGDITDEALSLVQMMAGQILEMYRLRTMMEKYVEEQVRAIAPNVTAILGAPVSARLIAKAGSLQRLATMPSSTVQVMGAERALFRSIKTGARPPKHGILFQHPLVHAAPRWQRGKIARAVAAKTAIAARVDLHEKEINKTLLEKLNVRVGEIDKKYRDPPPPSEHERRGERRGGDRRGNERRGDRRDNDRRGPRRRSGQKRGGPKKRKRFGR